MAGSVAGEATRRKVHPDMLGLDLSSTGRKMVRLKKAQSGWGLIGIDYQPLNSESSGTNFPAIPKQLAAHQVSISTSGLNAIIRLITFPGRSEAQRITEASLRDQIGLDDHYRLSYRMLPSQAKGETRLLTVALPNSEVLEVLEQYDQPHPAPLALEISGLSALEAFMSGSEIQSGEDAFGFIESGANTTLAAFISKGQLVLLRKFNFGGNALVEKVQKDLKLEASVARELVNEGSFDLSDTLAPVVEPFFRQLSISKDFVERHQRVRLQHMYVSGGLGLSQYWLHEFHNKMGLSVSPWNPFERLPIDGDIPLEFKKAGPRFTSAVGAAIGALEA